MCLPGESLEALDAEGGRVGIPPALGCPARQRRSWSATPATASGPAGPPDGTGDGVFLAGDAAHQTPPFAGQGMCAGLRDAANLAWKLDHVLDHPEDAALLETYDTERIPQAAAVIEMAAELGRWISVSRQRQEAAFVDAADGAAGPTWSADSRAAHAWHLGRHPRRLGGVGPALHPIHGAIRRRRGSARRCGRTRLAPDCRRPTGTRGRTRRLVRVRSGDASSLSGSTVEDVEGCYGRWFAEHHVAAVLERPDFAIYGTAGSDRDVPLLISRLRARLDQS